MCAIHLVVNRIDHIKVSVPDHYEVAKWYQDVLGLTILRGPAWDAAAALPGGPLFLGVDDADIVDGTKVVLLEGEPLSNHAPVGLTRASFGVDAESFLLFLARLDALTLFSEEGERLTCSHLVGLLLLRRAGPARAGSHEGRGARRSPMGWDRPHARCRPGRLFRTGTPRGRARRASQARRAPTRRGAADVARASPGVGRGECQQWIAWSLYFNDPDGNRDEVLTYAYEPVRVQVQAAPFS
jgi:hypothetical protein